MSVNRYDATQGELVTLANGTRMWVGTQSAHDIAVANHTMPNNCMVCITDDYYTNEGLIYINDTLNPRVQIYKQDKMFVWFLSGATKADIITALGAITMPLAYSQNVYFSRRDAENKGVCPATGTFSPQNSFNAWFVVNGQEQELAATNICYGSFVLMTN